MAFNLGSILVKLGLDNSGLEKGLKESKGELSSFGGEVTKIGAAIGVAFGVKEITRFGAAAFDLSQKFKPVSQAFERTGVSLLALREATGGAVSDFNLLQNTVKAQNFGIPVERLSEAFRFATIRAAETGESVDYLVNSIVTGIGRKSALVLDNLGISAVDIQDEFQKTGDFAQAAFNLIERESAKSTLAIEDATTSAAKFNAALDNITLAIGNVINSDALSGFFDAISEGAKKAADDLNLFAGAIPDLQQQLSILKRQLDEQIDTENTFFGRAVNALSGGAGDAETSRLLRQIEEVQNAIMQAGREGFATWTEADRIVKTTTDSVVELSEKIKTDLIPALEGVGQKAITEFNKLQKALENTIDRVSAAGVSGFDGASQLGGFNALGGRLGADFGPVQDGLKPGVDAVKESYAEIQQATLDLGNFVAGSFTTLGETIGDALSGTFDGSTFLKSLAAFGAAFGKQLVAIGVASLGLKEAIKNPFAAIAAGVGLIALSKIIANTAANASSAVSNLSNGGSGFSQARSSNIGGFNNFNNEAPTFVVTVGPHEFMTAYDYSSGVVGRTTGRRRG